MYSYLQKSESHQSTTSYKRAKCVNALDLDILEFSILPQKSLSLVFRAHVSLEWPLTESLEADIGIVHQ